MNQNFSSLKPLEGANRSLRSRLDLKGELALATAPTVLILTVLALVEALSRQHLLFVSLASSAFLIYLLASGVGAVCSLDISKTSSALTLLSIR